VVIQSIITNEDEFQSLKLLERYADELQERLTLLLSRIPTKTHLKSTFRDIFLTNDSRLIQEYFQHNISSSVDLTSHINYVFQSKQPTLQEFQEFLLSFLLSEATGGIRTAVKIFDFPLTFVNYTKLLTSSDGEAVNPKILFNEKLHFRLGIGLAKLGLYELSVKHMGSVITTQKQSLLYKLRAKLILNSIHSSIGSLAIAINLFERNIESILLSSSYAYESNNHEMNMVCNSPNEAAIAFQALPLLHLLGYSSPRIGNSLGHSPIPLPMLLGEVYLKMCPLLSDFNETYYSKDLLPFSSDIIPENFQNQKANQKKRIPKTKIRLGVVAGTFDGLTGRLMIGLFAGLSEHTQIRNQFEIIALCFPTPRSIVTDRVTSLFDEHINLSPENKTQIIDRIQQYQIDFLLFMDAALDARVFALAHERLSTFQGLYWTYGSSLAIPTIDYYFYPEIFWSDTKCPKASAALNLGNLGSSGSISSSLSYYNLQHLSNYQLPQELFHEQVVFLEGIPFIPRLSPLSSDELRLAMKAKYLLDINNRTNLYLLPISVKYLHPEFDKSLEVILRTDPRSMIIIATMRIGRDSLPTTHLATRHDLMHPSMPIAAINKLRKRFSSLMREELSDRIHILPPLDEPLYIALQRQSVAILDSYPVGLHVPIIEGILDSVPIVSLPFLQECANSHAINIQKAFNISYYNKLQKKMIYFTTPEEYGVLAVQLAKDTKLRNEMIISGENLKKFSPLHSNSANKNTNTRGKDNNAKISDYSQYDEFNQYYQQNHYFVQILKFILNLKKSFTK
jgi:hypothetical protein